MVRQIGLNLNFKPWLATKTRLQLRPGVAPGEPHPRGMKIMKNSGGKSCRRSTQQANRIPALDCEGSFHACEINDVVYPLGWP
jgi:hypothetical protein